MLSDCDINRNLIHGMKKEDKMPSADKLAKIVCYLKVSVEYLLGLTDDPTPPKKELTLDEQIAAEWYKMSDGEREQLKEYMQFLKIKKDLQAKFQNGSAKLESESQPD